MADTVSVTRADRERAAEILGGATPDGLLEGRKDSLTLVQGLARHRIASTQPAPAFPMEEVARQEMYAILRKWDVGDFASRVCSGKGHGSLPADICEAELDAFGESLIAALLQGKQP